MPAREVGGAATLHDCLDTVTHYNYTGANAEMDAKLAAKIVNSNADLPPGGPPAPGVPVNLTATAAGTSQVNVTWSASSGSVDHYEIERKSSGGAYTWVGI
ncbi:MAG: fibronectin type III domain-containing protein, partial [Acidobacteria bacterium]|nr:fibronectin type III domain-containing protein [Acidobacteriota bacterium]